MNKKIFSATEIQNFVAKIIFKNKIPKEFIKSEILQIKNIDSFVMIKVIVNIEQKYKIKFNDSEIFSKNFKNILSIAALIKKKLN